MRKISIRSVAGIVLLLVLLGSSVLTTSAAPSGPLNLPAGPTVKATLHDNWQGNTNIWTTPVLRALYGHLPRYTLHVVGTNFEPSAAVEMALLDTPTLRVVHQGVASAHREFMIVTENRVAVRSPLAGAFAYEASFNAEPLSAAPHLWCRSTAHLDIHNVTLE
jgi:hypothetical protein